MPMIGVRTPHPSRLKHSGSCEDQECYARNALVCRLAESLARVLGLIAIVT